MHSPRQSGFTIVEMLVATLIFMVGFMAVYGLFLGGMKFRSEADAITRSAVAASNIVNEMRLGSIPLPAVNGPVDSDFHAYRDQPGLFYRISGGSPVGDSAARKVSMQFVYLGIPGPTVSAEQVQSRFRRAGDAPGQPSIDDLVERGIILSYPAVIYPR